MSENARTLDLVPSDMGSLSSRPRITDILKRGASPSFDGPEETRRKKPKEDIGEARLVPGASLLVDGRSLAEHLAQELQCDCCSELVYLPVVVSPCQHFFCGR
jgi:E3 ubiquitin-protein ligase CHFR